jgi:hypothetical protein
MPAELFERYETNLGETAHVEDIDNKHLKHLGVNLIKKASR